MMKCDKEKIIITGTENDKRLKVPKSEYKIIIKMHKDGYSMRELAKIYNVSHRLIFCIIHNNFNKKEKGKWRDYYDKEKHRISIQKYREHKTEILNGGI